MMVLSSDDRKGRRIHKFLKAYEKEKKCKEYFDYFSLSFFRQSIFSMYKNI
jgi:hypothetical protein